MAAAATSTNATIYSMKLKGEVIGEWRDHRIMPGVTFGWAPAGTNLIAFSERNTGTSRHHGFDRRQAEDRGHARGRAAGVDERRHAPRLSRRPRAQQICAGRRDRDASSRLDAIDALLDALPAILVAAGCSWLRHARRRLARPTAQFAAGVDIVEVEVSVTDKSGRPITDLTARDFDLREDGQPQAIQAIYLATLDPSDSRRTAAVASGWPRLTFRSAVSSNSACSSSCST